MYKSPLSLSLEGAMNGFCYRTNEDGNSLSKFLIKTVKIVERTLFYFIFLLFCGFVYFSGYRSGRRIVRQRNSVVVEAPGEDAFKERCTNNWLHSVNKPIKLTVGGEEWGRIVKVRPSQWPFNSCQTWYLYVNGFSGRNPFSIRPLFPSWGTILCFFARQ